MTSYLPVPEISPTGLTTHEAKQLLDSGAITQADFDAIKAKALA